MAAKCGMPSRIGEAASSRVVDNIAEYAADAYVDVIYTRTDQ